MINHKDLPGIKAVAQAITKGLVSCYTPEAVSQQFANLAAELQDLMMSLHTDGEIDAMSVLSELSDELEELQPTIESLPSPVIYRQDPTVRNIIRDKCQNMID